MAVSLSSTALFDRVQRGINVGARRVGGRAALAAIAAATGTTAVVLVALGWRLRAARAIAPRLRARRSSIGLSQLICTDVFGMEHAFQSVITVRITFAASGDNANCADDSATIWDSTNPSGPSALRAFLEPILQHHRFRSVPMLCASGSVEWVTQRVHIADHVHEHHVPGPTAAAAAAGASSDALKEFEQKLVNAHLRRSDIPWWEVHLVRLTPPAPREEGRKEQREATAAGQSSTILYFRINHGIGDGVSLADACLEGLTDADGKPLSLEAALPTLRGGAKQQSATSGDGTGKARRGRGQGAWLRMCTLPFRFAGNVARAALLPNWPSDGANVFNDPNRQLYPPHVEQVPVYFPSHKLDFIKKLRLAVDPAGKVTVNDVAFGLLAGTFRRFLQAHPELCGAGLERVRLRSMSPLALPQPPHPAGTRYHYSIRNFFTFIINDFPIHVPLPRERVMAAAAMWSTTKTSSIVPATLLVTWIASKLPLAFRQAVARNLQKNTSILFSNVPGPQFPVFVRNLRIHSAHIMCPNLNPYIGLFSLDGWVHMCGTFYDDASGCVAANGAPIRVDRDELKRQLQQDLPHFFAVELTELAVACGLSADEAAAAMRCPLGTASA